MRNKNKTLYIVVLLLTAILVAVSAYFLTPSRGESGQSSENSKAALKAYDDVRKFIGMSGQSKDINNMDLRNMADIIPTLWFNEKTVWPSKMPADCDPAKILESTKNPGLGVSELHKQGITGKGINVAIIDQPLYQDHPEFAGKIKMYKDFDCKSESSMHGPAVTSLLVGNTIGTAPGANVYYAATPTWLADAGYLAKALDWIVEENNKLPAGDKIRVVSISAAPSGTGSPFTENNDLWDKAAEKARSAGILVLDCTSDKGIISSCYFDKGDMEKPSSYKPGYPGSPNASGPGGHIFVPTSPRTTAEEYTKGDFTYQYTGRGGLSWAIPYCSGVLAMGWQVNPDLTADTIVNMLFKSAYKTSDGSLIIDPPEFIRLVIGSK